MDGKTEILLTSDEAGQSWNCCAWDFTNGTTLKVFKPGVSGARTLQLLGGEYIISAEFSKPIINVWSLLNKGQQQHVKFVCPGKVSALAATPDGSFCVAAIEDKLFVWQICTGELLGVVRHHYSQVNCVKVSDDGAHVISAAEDNLVCVWKLSRLLGNVEGLANKAIPMYSWSDSFLPVTDVHIGVGGRKARVVTVSLDHSCRMYSLRSGDLLMTVVLEVSLNRVVMDAAEFYIFVGGSEGSIFTINLIEPPPTFKSHISGTHSLTNTFVGHSKRITALAVSYDGQFLISGSEDKSVRVWDVSSKQCLRNLTHRGVVTNVMIIPALAAFTSTSTVTIKHSLSVKPFQHNVIGSDGVWQHTANIMLDKSPNLSMLDSTVELAKTILNQKDETKIKLINEVEELQKLNFDLYQKTLAEIVGS